MTALVTRCATQEGVQATPLPRLHLIRYSQPSAPLHVLHEPALCLIVQGAKKVLLGNQLFHYDAAHCLIVSASLPVVGEILQGSPGEPYLCLRLDLDRDLLRELLAAAGACPAPGAAPSAGLTLQAVTPNLLDAFTRLVGLLDHPEEISVLAPLFEREVLYRALQGGAATPMHQVIAGTGKALQITQVMNRLKDTFTAPYRLEALTQEVHMSRTALHQHFKTMTGLTPLQYHKQLRLQEARRLMQGQTHTAEAAGHAVGYESASQFSREYRRLFGASPRQDAAQQATSP
ncbi:AraC family transcriptional regulator [Deinococcus sp. Arct2-2]|uniref:AraC family transcriptional regulator n=1 Tax=Deinococcus sp. Arct2-2 TaxID=2568653 RepID=UPI001454C0C4|nr:AraC family transcriptional regulator [Deinococcus sp. Arct2-2]